jgi:phage terminase large subunit-like protein
MQKQGAFQKIEHGVHSIFQTEPQTVEEKTSWVTCSLITPQKKWSWSLQFHEVPPK